MVKSRMVRLFLEKRKRAKKFNALAVYRRGRKGMRSYNSFISDYPRQKAVQAAARLLGYETRPLLKGRVMK